MKIYTNLNVSSEKTSTKKTLPMRFGTFEVNQLDTDNDGFEESEALEHQERGSGRKSRINRIAVSGCLKWRNWNLLLESSFPRSFQACWLTIPFYQVLHDWRSEALPTPFSPCPSKKKWLGAVANSAMARWILFGPRTANAGKAKAGHFTTCACGISWCDYGKGSVVDKIEGQKV